MFLLGVFLLRRNAQAKTVFLRIDRVFAWVFLRISAYWNTVFRTLSSPRRGAMSIELITILPQPQQAADPPAHPSTSAQYRSATG